MLGEKLGVTLVESSDPLWTPDPGVEQMKVDYRVALARLVPVFMPDLLFRVKERWHAGVPGFRRRGGADRVRAGQDVRLRQDAADRLLRRHGGGPHRAAAQSRPRHHPESGDGDGVPLPHLAIPVAPRGRLEGQGLWRDADRLAALNARSKFWGDDQRAAFKNWEEVADPRNPFGQRQGVNERIMLRELLRRADMMVILEYKLDALVRLHTPWPPGLIGHAYQYDIASNLRPELLSGPNAGLTEVLIPAGYVTTAYDPVYQLTPDGKRYVSQRPTSRRRSRRPVCRSRWCFAPNRARRTCC